MNNRGSRSIMRALALYALSCGVFLPSSETQVRAATSRPNVLVVVLDDVGWQDVGFHDENFHTPHIDKLVSEGIELTAFYTSPECTPSRSQLMTGRYNYKIGMQDSVLRATEPRGLPLTETILPERMLDAGYQTAMVGKWHLGMHMYSYTPENRGFERQYGLLLGGGDHFTHLSDSWSVSARGTDGDLDTRAYIGPGILENGEVSADNDLIEVHSTELYTNKTISYISEMTGKDKPWFTYLAFQAVHTPIKVGKEWYTGNSCASINEVSGEEEFPGADDDVSWTERMKICGMMAQVDYGVGLIRTYLEEIGDWDNTVVLLFSDNGGVSSYGSLNLPYRGGKGEYWEGGVRVPAVIAGGYAVDSLSSGLGESYKYNHMVHITDMHATVLALAGVTNGAEGKSSGAAPAPKSVKKDVLGAAERSDGTLTSVNNKASKKYGAGVEKDGDSDGSRRRATAETPAPTASDTPSPTAAKDDSFETDGVDIWDAVMSTGDSVRTTMILNINSPLFANSGSVRHGRYKLTRNPDPDDSLIYSRVRSSLLDYNFYVSPESMINITKTVHEELHLDGDGHMYLFDMVENPYEKTTCADGGNDVSCSNLYHHESYSAVKAELVAIFEKAQADSAVSTFAWQDDGPLADPFFFGGWVPWRDDDGYPRSQYGGAFGPWLSETDRISTNPSVKSTLPKRSNGLEPDGRFGKLSTIDDSAKGDLDGGAREDNKPFYRDAMGGRDYLRQSSGYPSQDTDETLLTDGTPTRRESLGNAGATTKLTATPSVGADGMMHTATDFVGFLVAGGVGMVLGVGMIAAYRGAPRRGYSRLLS